MIKYEKANYYRNVLIKSKGDCRKLWKHFKEAIGKTPLITSPVLNIDGNTVTDLFEVTNAFNIYFTSVSSHVIEHFLVCIHTHPIDFANFLANKLIRRQTFSLPHVTELRVIYYLSQLQECKATGLDNISASLIRLAGVHVVPPLVHIINCSIDSGTFPSTWKVAKIFSLHKSGSPHDINNFRPISILPVTQKYKKDTFMIHFMTLSVNNLLSKSQFSFKKGYSCFTCLSSMINEWLLRIYNNNLVGFVALDFRKAFYVLPHDILLKKLQLYGCDELTIQWFHSYLYIQPRKLLLIMFHLNFVISIMVYPRGQFWVLYYLFYLLMTYLYTSKTAKYTSMLMTQVYVLLVKQLYPYKINYLLI